MRQLQRINFEQSKNVTKLGVCLLLIGLMVFLYAISKVVKTEILLQQIHRRQVELQGHAPMMRAMPEIKQTPEQIKVLAAIHQQFNYPWQQLFLILEHVDMQHISLLGLEPDIASGQLKLSAEADDKHAMFGYIKALSEEPTVNYVNLLSQDKKIENNQEKITFEAVIEIIKK